MDKKQIIDRLYQTYGSDSGVLFGIKTRGPVEAIVTFVLNQLMEQGEGLELVSKSDYDEACKQVVRLINERDYLEQRKKELEKELENYGKPPTSDRQS